MRMQLLMMVMMIKMKMIINLPQYQNIIWCPFNILSKSCPIPTHIISQSVSFPNNVTNTNHFQAVLLVFSICFLLICSFLSLITSQMPHFTVSLLLLMKCSHHGYDSAGQSRTVIQWTEILQLYALAAMKSHDFNISVQKRVLSVSVSYLPTSKSHILPQHLQNFTKGRVLPLFGTS